MSSERSYSTDEVRYLIELIGESALAQAQRAIAERAETGDLSWQLFKRISREDRVAARLAEMETQVRTQPWYREFPDDWDEPFLVRLRAWVRDGTGAVAVT